MQMQLLWQTSSWQPWQIMAAFQMLSNLGPETRLGLFLVELQLKRKQLNGWI